MLNINNQPYSVMPVIRQGVTRLAAEAGKIETQDTLQYSATLSILAQQLNLCASRAATREQALSNAQLGELAAHLQNQIDGDDYIAQKNTHDAEEPKTGSQEAHYWALQATAFTNGKITNPFERLTREQLSLVAYDDSEVFTVNQRRAAWQQIQLSEQLFHHSILQEAEKEYSQYSTLAQSAQKVLRHIENLPAIDKARYSRPHLEQLRQLSDSSQPLKQPQGSTLAIWVNDLLTPGKAEGPASPRVVETMTKNEAGHQLMLTRLYEGVEPPLRDGKTGMSLASMSLPACDFMTRQDRNLLSHIYAFAQQQGADLRYVDALAEELGDYRQHDDGSILINMNHGGTYDGTGHLLSVRFLPEVAAIAQQITTGEAFKSTQLDKGFLRFVTDPGFRPYSPVCDLKFLQQVMTRFSTVGGDNHALDSQFTIHPDKRIADRIVSASKEVKLEREESSAIRRGDVWIITAKGKAEGYVLNPLDGGLERLKPTPKTAEKKTSHRLDGFFDNPNVKRLFATPFHHLLMKYKLQGRVRKP